MTDVSVLSDSELVAKGAKLQVNLNDAVLQLRTLDPRPEARFDFRMDGKHAKTFLGAELDGPAFAAWLQEQNVGLKRQAYFSLNAARQGTPLHKSLSAADIGAIRAFPADMDPTSTRTKQDGLTDLQLADSPPTMLVDSGNGGWGYFLPPQHVTVESVDAVAQNKALIAHFASDEKCADISRITRLSGTYNWKDPANPKLAKLISTSGPRYTVAELASAYPPVPSRTRVDATQVGKEDAAVEVNSPAVIEACLSILAREDLVAIAGAGGRGVSIALLHALMDEGATADMAAILSHHFLKTEGEDWELHDLKKLARGLLPSRKLAIGATSAQAEFEPQITARLPLHWATKEALSNLPDRQWLLGKFLVRRAVTALVSPGGTGKTTFAMMVAVAVATGRSDILGFTVHERTRVLVWNQEDDLEEMKRRLRAVLQFYGVEDVDWEIDGRPGIVLGSGVERPLTIAKRSANGIVAGPDADLLALDIKENNIGVAILDPLIELHQASENDNVEMGAVGRALRDKIAVGANCAILLNHHTRKPPQANANGFAGDMDAGRGAGAMNGVFRVVATLFNVDQKTAKDFGIAEDKRHLYVRFDDAKANMSLKAGEPVFFRREGVRLPESVNDEIGVLSLAAMSKKKRTGDTLIEDAVAHLAGESEAWVTDLAAALTETAFYAEDEAADLARRITVAFRNAKNANGWVAETASRKGYKGPRVRLVFRPEIATKQNGKQT